MLVARKSHCNGERVHAVRHGRSLRYGRATLLRGRFVRSWITGNPRMYSKFIVPSAVAAVIRVWETASGFERVSAGVRESKPLSTCSALTENPTGVQSFSPGLRGTSYPGYARTNDSTLKGLNHSPLIKVENGLSPTFHRPIIRPENKGIKPITNRHRPKKSITGGRHAAALFFMTIAINKTT